MNRFSSTRIMLHDNQGPVMPPDHIRYNQPGFRIIFLDRLSHRPDYLNKGHHNLDPFETDLS